MNIPSFNSATAPQRYLLAVLTGILLAIMVIYSNPLCSFIALVPLIVAIRQAGWKQALLLGWVSGAVLSLFTSFWMLQSVAAFTGGKWYLALMAYLASSVLLGLVMLLAAVCLYPFTRNNHSLPVKSLGIACAWAAYEFLFGYFLTGSFWFQPALYKGMVSTGFLLQGAAFGGASLISFFCAWINAALALVYLSQKRPQLWFAGLILVLFFGLSYTATLVYPERTEGKQAAVALINVNQPVRLQWDEHTGNELVQQMLRLNEEAGRSGAGLKVWTEAVVPWTFRKDDDFLNAILDAGSGKTGHIIGLLTSSAGTAFYNSAYYLENMQQPVQRYDKQFPLAYAEVPLSIGAMPLLKGAGLEVLPGSKSVVFHTLVGRAGITVCNESLVDRAYYGLADQDADFLTVISNDGWIANSDYLLRQHFYSARIHAVAYRKDVLVNSNLGYSGAFSSMGEVLLKRKEDTGFTETVLLSRNAGKTFYARFPLFLICFYSLSLLLIYPLNPVKKE